MNNLKLSFVKEDTEVNVFEKHGVVVVKLHGFLTDFAYFGDEIVGTGVARLKKGDTFDKELGIKIATAKAENNAYRKAVNQMIPLMDCWAEQLSTYGDFVEKATNVLAHNENYVHNIGGTIKD